MKQQIKFYARGNCGIVINQMEVLNKHFNQIENGVLMNVYIDINKGDLDENRSGLNNMLNEIEEGDIILVSSFNRLSRSNVKFFEIKTEIEKKGGILESIDSYDSNPTSKFTMLIMQKFYEEMIDNEKFRK